MTNPTPLSPAAQAVLDAANGRSVYGPDDCLNESRWIAAAALRAAADCLTDATSAHTLYAITDELEAQ